MVLVAHWLLTACATKGIPWHPLALKGREKVRPGNDATRRFVSGLHLLSSPVISEGDGTRTRNHRIDSLNTPRCKPMNSKRFRPSKGRGCTLVAQTGPSCPPELARLVDAWPKLPEHVRRAILTLAEGSQ
jgi:hypothetical protein